MINLLPPEIKNQITYSKYNTTLIKLTAAVMVAGVILVTILRLGSANTDVSIDGVKRQVTQDKSDANIEKTLRDTAERFNTVSAITASRHHYSTFIRSLSAALPNDAIISGLELSAETKPITLNVTTASSSSAGKLKDAIGKLPQVQSAEVDAISQSGEEFSVTVNIVLKPEAFK